MPRKARLDAPGALHHIMIRGIERRKIFRDDGDREDFLVIRGDDDFVELLFFGADEKLERYYEMRRSGYDLDGTAKRASVCVCNGIKKTRRSIL